MQEEVVHRIRSPRHVGRDGIIRPSTAHETKGFYILSVSFENKSFLPPALFFRII